MANPLFVLESVGLACETLKFLEAERNYFLKCSGGGGDVHLNASSTSSQEQQNHNEVGDNNVGKGDAGSHDAEVEKVEICEEEKPSKKSKKSKDKASKSQAQQQQQPINKPQQQSCHQNKHVKNSQQGPVELPTNVVKTQNEEFSLSSLSEQVAKAREQILNSLINLNNESSTYNNAVSSSLLSLPKSTSCSHTHTCCNTLTPEEEAMLKEENARLARQVDDLQKQVKDLVNRVTKLEVSGVSAAPAPKAAAPSKKEESDDEDLFASDNEEESAEAEKIKAERIAAYAAKKSSKPALIAKSNVILDCKPWDDETDMKQMEKLVRAIEKNGLLWGASKLVEVGYGIKKLQISCVVEDDKISIEELTEQIESNEDFVQSVDIAAFNKV